MTTDPSSSYEGSALPPRHRPNLGKLAKDTSEVDLWAIEASEPVADELPAAPSKPPELSLPAPRNIEKLKRMPLQHDAVSITGAGKDQIKLNVGKPNSRQLPTGSPANPPKPGSDFDELEQWQEPEPEPLPPVIFQENQEIEAKQTIPASGPVAGTMTPPEDDQNEFPQTPRENSAVVPLRPQWNLSKIESIGLIALIGMLVIGGIAAFLATVSRLPTESERGRSNDFPVKGKYVIIQAADSHWRAPKEGDAVRRGTQLLPVVDFVASGGPAAIRIFFRNSDGELIGDPVTRFIQSAGKLQVAATAGFDDVGMHAAYRTGQSKPWSIEVLEAPLADSPVSAFVKLFEMDISTDLR